MRIKSPRFEAVAVSENNEATLRFCVSENDRDLNIRDVLDLWELDPEFVDFYISIFKRCGFLRYVWETPAMSTHSMDRTFEFVIHDSAWLSGPPDRQIFADYYNTEAAREGIVAFDNLGGDALLVVPSPYWNDADYSGLAAFFRNAPVAQQRTLWHELARHVKSRLSEKPIWVSVAGGGVPWLHIRLDDAPKYYRYGPYTEAR